MFATRLTCVLFAGLVCRSGLDWAHALTGAALPHLGGIGYTLIFAAFSLMHAGTVLGWRRALTFFCVSAIVSWIFEQVGVATGLIYGAYHYSDRFGAKLGFVPIIIPLAWFMMIYPAWVIAHVLLRGAGTPGSWRGMAARAIVAAFAMTAWDVVMDPGHARAGDWVWEQGGPYFGVPLQNFVGWMATTFAVYLLTGALFRTLRAAKAPPASDLYVGLPVLAYALVALDGFIVSPIPELRIVAAFGICLIALIGVLRLALIPQAILAISGAPAHDERRGA